MVNFIRSYSSILQDTLVSVRLRLFSCIFSGKSTDLNEILSYSQYAQHILLETWTNRLTGERLSLLMMATLHGHDEIVKSILKYTNDIKKLIELQGRIRKNDGQIIDGITALWCALDRCHFHIAQMLIDSGKAKLEFGSKCSLLIDAAVRERLDIIDFLIQNGYMDINLTTTDQGNTALMMAAINGCLLSVKKLRSLNACLRIKNSLDKTATMMAIEHEKLDVADYLLECEHEHSNFEDTELLISSHILLFVGTPEYKSEWVIKTLKYLISKRKLMNIKTMVMEPIAFYEHQTECRTIDELDRIQNDDHRLRLEALMIQERMFRQKKEPKIFRSLIDIVNALVKNNEFDKCLTNIEYFYELSRTIDMRPYFRDLFWPFYNMLNSTLSLPDRFWDLHSRIFQSDNKLVKNNSYLLGCLAIVDPPDIALILNELKINESDVANIYYHGSWAQDTCTPKSDHDLILVTRLEQQRIYFTDSIDYFHRFELHKLFDKYDVCVYSVENFTVLLENHYLYCVQCLFLPAAFKLKEEIDFRSLYLEKFYDSMKIKRGAFYELYHSFNLINLTKTCPNSNRSSQKPKHTGSRADFLFKNLFHGLRFLDIAEQLLQTKTISDFTRLSNLYVEMKKMRKELTNEQGKDDDDSELTEIIEFVRSKSVEFKQRLNAYSSPELVLDTYKIYIEFESNEKQCVLLENLLVQSEITNFKIQNIFSKNAKVHQSIFVLSQTAEYNSIVQIGQNLIKDKLNSLKTLSIKIKSSMTNKFLPMTGIEKELFWADQKSYFQFNYLLYVKRKYDVELFSRMKSKVKQKPMTDGELTPLIIQVSGGNKFYYIIRLNLYANGASEALCMDEVVVKYLRSHLTTPISIDRGYVIYDDSKSE